MKVKKRNGSLVEFDKTRISTAIIRAMQECGAETVNEELAQQISQDCFDALGYKEVIDIEEIQDYVELQLMTHLPHVAKRYIIYRIERQRLRQQGWQMTDLQRDIYVSKYQYDNENFNDFLLRVSGGNDKIAKLMRDKKFLPAGRILAGRGLYKDGRKITYSNCYVIKPPEDNLESIFDAAKQMARTYSYGGGVGVDISNLRPRGFKVNNAAKTTSGAVSFMDLYSLTTGLIGQNARRGALMISLRSDHPDIEEFINVKNDLSKITKANISIRVSDDFMRHVAQENMFTLRFNDVVKEVDALTLYEQICYNNWNMAEPGMLFWDKIKSWHLMSADKNFEFAGVNPCAEEPLPAYGSCNLAAINLAEFVQNAFTDKAEIDFFRLRQAIRDGIIYLNEILDENTPLHPLNEQQEVSKQLRQIGLGVMGVADMFIKLGVRYGSEDSLHIIDRLGRVFINEALQQSALLAAKDGPFPLYNKEAVFNSTFFQSNADKETVDLVSTYGLRNSQLLTIAPTGSIATLLGVSNGIEPLYQLSYIRKTESLHGGKETYYKVTTPIVREYMLLNEISDEEDLPDIITTTANLHWADRINVQAHWQRYIDAAISSTINLPEDTTVKEIADIYMYAWQQGLKGVTIYRDNCARTGILIADKPKVTIQDRIADLQEKINELAVDSLKENPGECPICGGKMNVSGGCEECQDCGYSPCSI